MLTAKTKNRPISATGPVRSFADLLTLRRTAREEFLQAGHLKKTGRTPIVGLVTAGADAKLVDELKEATQYLDLYFLEIADINQANLYACDIAVFLSTDLARGREAAAALAYGAIPVVYERIAPKLFSVEYDPIDESGNSFFFRQESPWAIFAALTCAVETYRFPYDWQGIVRNAISANSR